MSLEVLGKVPDLDPALKWEALGESRVLEKVPDWDPAMLSCEGLGELL